MIYFFIIIQCVLLLFMAFHDWVDIPPFTNLKALRMAHSFKFRLMSAQSVSRNLRRIFMKHAYLFLAGLLSLAPMLTNTHAFAENTGINVDAHKPLVVSYLQDLEELGYSVIPDVLSISEAEALYQRVWHEFIEKAWPNCKMDDRGNWKEAFPIHNKMGIFAGPAGQTQVMWDLRQDPRIVDVFAQVWTDYPSCVLLK